ncbi:unnamed protein product [Rotaria magnacalcarata]|uniref:Uncharacterized protein n=1 Tax=Rotaria magnacalcarata TaxID=392030 RepID=A0A8S3J0J5_9BILA|nr:unnamed protein product [Rotaria magnacalcarata]
MTSSSTIRKSTTLEDQVEHNNDYNKKPLAQSGLMEQFIHIILNVNEKLFNSKRSQYNNGDDESDRKHRRILEEINLPVSILSTPPTPTYTERILVDEDF